MSGIVFVSFSHPNLVTSHHLSAALLCRIFVALIFHYSRLLIIFKYIPSLVPLLSFRLFLTPSFSLISPLPTSVPLVILPLSPLHHLLDWLNVFLFVSLSNSIILLAATCIHLFEFLFCIFSLNSTYVCKFFLAPAKL